MKIVRMYMKAHDPEHYKVYMGTVQEFIINPEFTKKGMCNEILATLQFDGYISEYYPPQLDNHHVVYMNWNKGQAHLVSGEWFAKAFTTALKVQVEEI